MINASDMVQIFIGYTIVFMLGIGIIVYFQNKFFFPWMRVRASRGKKTLVRVLTMSDDYFRVGQIDEGVLVFTDRTKEKRRVTVPPSALYRSLGVNCIDLDDDRNTVFDRKEWRVVNGFDGKKYDAIYERILMRPGKKDMLMIVVLIIVIVICAASLYNAYLTYQLTGMVKSLGQVATNTITAGV